MNTGLGNRTFCFHYKQERFSKVQPECEFFHSYRQHHGLCCVLFFFFFLSFSCLESLGSSGLCLCAGGSVAVDFGGPLSRAALQKSWQKSLAVSPPEFLKAEMFTKHFCFNRLQDFPVALEGFQLPLMWMPFCWIETLGSFPRSSCTYQPGLNSHLGTNIFLFQVISECAPHPSLIGGSGVYTYHCYDCRKIWEMPYLSYLEACVKMIRLMNEQSHTLLFPSIPNLINIRTLCFS